MIPKIRQLIDRFPDRKIDAFLVTKEVNIRYLTGFPASESWFFVTPKRAYYITDFRYVLEARQGLPAEISIQRYTKSFFDTLFKIAAAQKIRRLGFDERHIFLSTFKKLKAACPKDIQLVPADNLVEELRERKSAEEIQHVRAALQLHRQALGYIRRFIKPGTTEKELLNRLENYVKSRDALFSFDPIIASGPNSSYPHARVSRRKLRPDEPVLLDMGIDLNGYKSDLTRMFFLGKMPRFFEEIQDAVRRAQQSAIKKIRAGIPAAFVDSQARNYLIQKKLGKFFGHSLGHGVGLEIHESPSVSFQNPGLLKEGMIITVEPAVYIPNRFGIRLEEMVLVKKEGCEVLSADIH